MRTIDATTVATAIGSPSPQRIRWGAVFGGAILGMALLALLTSLWFSLAYASEIDRIRGNLEWYVGGSAIACLFVAGLLAGWLSGVRGAGSGFFNGLTIWALMVALVVTVGIPATFDVFNLGRVTALDPAGGLLEPDAGAVLWATFSAIVGGLVTSGIGGAIGGALARPANLHLVNEIAERQADIVERRPARPDVEGRTVVVPDLDDMETSREAVHSRRSS